MSDTALLRRNYVEAAGRSPKTEKEENMKRTKKDEERKMNSNFFDELNIELERICCVLLFATHSLNSYLQSRINYPQICSGHGSTCSMENLDEMVFVGQHPSPGGA